jgi:cobalt-zinc-cadmium efflux system outer membrane protein
MKTALHLSLLLLLLWAAIPLRSAAAPITAPLAGLTLEQALRTAAKDHPRLRAALAKWNAAEQRAIAAGLRPNPKVIIGTEGLPFSANSVDKADYVVGVSQKIRLNKTAKLTRVIAGGEREKAALHYTAAGNRVRQEVHAAFATALYAQINEQLFAKRIAILEANSSLLKALYAAGETVPDAVEMAHAALDHETLDHNESESLGAKAFASLAVALGQPDIGIESVIGELEPTLGLADLERAATKIDQLPHLLAADAGGDVLALRAKLAKASRIPSLNLTLLYRRDQANRQNGLDANVSFSIPLFNDKKAAAKAFEADTEFSRANTELMRQQTALAVGGLNADLRIALKRAKHIRDEILPHRDEILRRQKVLFESGETSRLVFNKARLIATEERRHYLDTLREVHRLWARLQGYIQPVR